MCQQRCIRRNVKSSVKSGKHLENPQGLPDGIKSANKTGETDQDQHDIAIVYGEKTTYILCIMSEGCPEETAVTNIQKISKIVYNYLNL